MNKYGNTDIPVDLTSSPIPNITTPPPDMTPISDSKKKKSLIPLAKLHKHYFLV